MGTRTPKTLRYGRFKVPKFNEHLEVEGSHNPITTTIPVAQIRTISGNLGARSTVLMTSF